MIYGYIRVSTDKQTVENQRREIVDFVKNRNLKIDKFIEETISGTKMSSAKFQVLLKELKKGDVLIISELSRLSRKMFEIMECLKILLEQNIKVFTVKEGYELGDTITAKVLAFAFGLSAEIERNLISQRTKAGLAQKRAEGAVLGHPVGKLGENAMKLNNFKKEIRNDLKAGLSFLQIGRNYGVSRNSVIMFLSKNHADLVKTPFLDLKGDVKKLIKQGNSLREMIILLKEKGSSINIDQLRMLIYTTELYNIWAKDNFTRRQKYKNDNK